ncbi:acylphosphatase [Xanthomonas campestris]|uniref:acylphosphatase n=1 Tax=Xanthomonas euroxanthea TaxID=2259622 RepID=UPI000CEE0945|nr:acylphosphatase [Xanthomonas euroxanthea]NIJ94105.1 acylphosphatase [Xanthomonas euroxanthea]PPT32699.1 acylphosphatase [Xanthomonas arboricola]
MQAARFLVTGVVQGVWFRAATRERAVALGLRGHARNLPDGSVEVLAAGTDAALDALETRLWQGPPAARVAAVTRMPCAQPPTEECVTG